MSLGGADQRRVKPLRIHRLVQKVVSPGADLALRRARIAAYEERWNQCWNRERAAEPFDGVRRRSFLVTIDSRTQSRQAADPLRFQRGVLRPRRRTERRRRSSPRSAAAPHLPQGIVARSSSSRFGPICAVKLVTPVRLPPGRARLATSPIATGSPPTKNTIGIVVVAALAASTAGVAGAAITVT